MPDVIRMVRDLSGPLPSLVWPEGVSLVALADADPAELHALMKLAYAEGGGSVPDIFETWWTATSTDSEFDPTLCFIAEDALGQVAGFALVWNSSFIKDLVVHPGHRRRGLGGAILAEAMRVLKARGLPSAALKVQADNPNAQRLYSRMGFVEAPA